MTADDVRAALRRHYGLAAVEGGAEEWTLHDEVGVERWAGITIDMLAIRAWSGRPKGHERHAIEIKVSRSDFRRDIASGKWAVWTPYVHRFYFAAPAGLLKLDEIPDGCGLIVVDGAGCRKLLNGDRRDPEPLPEAVWVDLARRASRLAERLRRGDGADAAAELARLKIETPRLQARVASLHESIREYRARLGQLLKPVRDGDVICAGCRTDVDYRRDPRSGRWHWEHVERGACYIIEPIPRDLADIDAATA